MKKNLLKFIALVSIAAIGATIVADAATVRVRRNGPRHRTTVVVRTGHPIHRAFHPVFAVRPAFTVRVAPAVFLPLVVWRPVVVVARPAPDVIAWQDSEEIEKDDDWTEINFDSDQRGEKLYLEVVSGKVQFDFAEVVFENGDCQVVDFNEKTHGVGFYELLDFKNGRKVDHVRLIAKSRTNDAKIALVMRK